MALDPQLLAILTGAGNLQSGNPNYLPSFQGGQGLDQNLLALLMSQGMLPKRFAGDGSYILPNAPQPRYGFHSPSQLDAFKNEGSMADRFGPYAGIMPSATNGRESTPEEIGMLSASDQQQQMQAQRSMYQPNPQELASMQAIRQQVEMERKRKMAAGLPGLKVKSPM